MYCSPEQMQDSKRADERADVFSLGRMLYELYTGELTSAIQDLSLVPALIAPIVDRATATDPDRRYPSVEKMLEEFDGVMEVLLGVAESGSLGELIEGLRAAAGWSDAGITRLVNGLDKERS
jgi:eukaryotic-like serine/threonine-protein kinase